MLLLLFRRCVVGNVTPDPFEFRLQFLPSFPRPCQQEPEDRKTAAELLEHDFITSFARDSEFLRCGAGATSPNPFFLICLFLLLKTGRIRLPFS